MRSSNSTSFAMYSPRLSDMLWEALNAACLLLGLGVDDVMGRLVAGTLAVGGGRFIDIDGDEC